MKNIYIYIFFEQRVCSKNENGPKSFFFFFWTVSPVFEQKNKDCVCEILEKFSVFAQEKEFVIKLLKILKWVNCSVQAHL